MTASLPNPLQNRLLYRSAASKYFADVGIRTFHDPTPSVNRHHPHGPHASQTNTVGGLRTVAWNNLGTRIAAGGVNGSVKIWNPEKLDPRSSTDLKATGLHFTEKVQWDPTHAERLASCGTGESGIVKFWDYRTAKATSDIKTGGDNHSLAYHPDGNVVVVSRKDNRIKFLDLRQNAIFHTIEDGHDQTYSLLFSYSGTLLFQTHLSGAVKIRSFPQQEVLYTWEAHTSVCNCLDLDPKGKILATGGSDALVSLWDTSDWACIRSFDKADHPIRSVGFSWDSAYLVAGSDELMNLEIVHAYTGETVHEFKTNYPAHAVAWHPSKYVLAYTGEALKITGLGGSF